jgi:transcriptional repressor NrdR
MQLTVVKRSGATEAFDRDKAIAGVRKACKGRPLTEDDLARLGHVVEDTLRGSGQAEFASHEVGMAILEPLRELDEVAYLRFAAVYKQFETAEDFEIEIASLRKHRAEQLAAMLEPVSAPSG